MKKIVLSMAGVLAATAFAPEASAIPAFARQTGLACTSCHFQHYPVLSTTGQEFKVGAYTQLSAKGKFKGDDLSIPDQLNAAILLKARYQKTGGSGDAGIAGQTNTVGGDTNRNAGQWQIPDEISLFFGGRIGDSGMVKMGFMNENNMTAAGMLAGFKIPVAIALDPVTIQVVPFITDALGQAYGFEQSSTGMTRGVRWAEHRSEISAAQYTSLGSGTASGIAFVVASDMGYINFTRWSPNFAYLAGSKDATGTGVTMSSNWIRVAATPTIADWAMHIGVGMASGSNYCDRTSASVAADGSAAIDSIADKCDTKGSVIDMQAQGAVGEMETSVYVQYAKADKSAAGGAALGNAFNSKVTDKKALTIGADFTVIPHTLSIGAAIRKANTGLSAADQTAGRGDKDDALTVTAVYDLFQNVALHANYSMYSGSAYDANGTKRAASLAGGEGKSLLTLMLEAAW